MDEQYRKHQNFGFSHEQEGNLFKLGIAPVNLQDGVIHVHKDATDEDLRIPLLALWTASQDGPQRLCIYGYDHDARELWEIPEVIDLARRLVNNGYLSFLAIDVDFSKYGWGSPTLHAVAHLPGARVPGKDSNLRIAVNVEALKEATIASNYRCMAILAAQMDADTPIDTPVRAELVKFRDEWQTAYKEGKLSQDHIDQFKDIPGWSWTP